MTPNRRGTSRLAQVLRKIIFPSLMAGLLFAAGGAAYGNTNAPSTERIGPSLSINIPGVTFQRIDTVGAYIDIPWIANYLSGVYSYAVGVAGLLASVMFVIGGFQYLTAGGDSSRVSQGRERITNAIIGLFLVFASYIILLTINPDLVSVAALRVKTVIGHRFEIEGNPGVPPGAGGTGGTGQRGDPAVVDGILKASREVGVDPCTMLTICQHETGLTLRIWNGAPSNSVDNAIAFGPCQVVANNLRPGSPLDRAAREHYPDYPTVDSPPAEAKRARAEWLMTNAEGSAFIAAKILKGNGSNEVLAIAGYGAGLASVRRWYGANGCTPQSRRVSEVGGQADQALRDACIPTPPQYPTILGVADPCAADNYNCSGVHVNSRAEFEGTCATGGAVCKTIDTGGFARYVINQYPNVRQTYPQCASSS